MDSFFIPPTNSKFKSILPCNIIELIAHFWRVDIFMVVVMVVLEVVVTLVVNLKKNDVKMYGRERPGQWWNH